MEISNQYAVKLNKQPLIYNREVYNIYNIYYINYGNMAAFIGKYFL